MIAEIVTIGDEILIGQIVDTNSAWIAEKLNLLGIRVNRITSIPDSKDSIYFYVYESFNRSDLVIVTGGLGPTNDDITKSVLNDFFGGKLIIHQPSLKNIEDFFRRRNLPLTEVNRKQAEVPNVCTALLNCLGTAPGMWFEKENKVLISLPGVPFEMVDLMEREVIPRLKSAINDQIIIHRTIQTFGIGESFLAEKISDWERNLPYGVKLAYLPSPVSIRLRLSAYGSSTLNLESTINEEIEKLYQIIPNYIFGEGEVTLQQVVGQMLKKMNATVSTAESCTGGTIAHLLTEVPGSSSYFKGGIVAYSNEVKENELGVSAAQILKYGAVSQQVVESMVIGVRKKLMTDYAIAISGIAGPDGGTDEKPVGTVWIALSSDKTLMSKEMKFGSDRKRNILRTSVTALNMLRLLLHDENL